MAHLFLLPLVLTNSLLKTQAQGFGMNLIKIPDNDRAQIVCTVALLSKYFYSTKALSGSVLQFCMSSASIDLQQQLMHALHLEPNFPWTIVVDNSSNMHEEEMNTKHVLNEKPQSYFYVIGSTEVEGLAEVFEKWKTNLNWNPLAQFVIYLSVVKETDQNMTGIMKEILLTFMDEKVYNVNVIEESEENSFYLGKTVFPYHPDNKCGKGVTTLETLDVCNYQEIKSDREKERGEYKENEQKNYTEHKRQDQNKKNVNEDSQTSPNVKYIKMTKDMVAEFKNMLDDLKETDYPKLNIKELRRALFFDKFPKDLSGCPLVVAYRSWEPYIFNEAFDKSLHTPSAEVEANNTNADDKQQDVEQGESRESISKIHLSGIEYKLIQTIAERLHVKIIMQTEINNVYQLVQELIDGDAQLVAGGIDEDPNLSQLVSSTIPYHQDDLTWCVSKAKYTPNFFNFLAIFQTRSWLLTLLFILTASLNISLAQQWLKLNLGILRNYVRINVYVIGIILNQCIHLKPMPTSLKLCFGTIFIMGFMFGNIYHSFLVSTLTTSKTSYQISHLAEIYQNRMHIMASVENVRHLSKEGEIYQYVREHFQMCYKIEKCLQQAATNTKLAVAVSRQHYFYNPFIPRDDLYCFDRNENIYVYLVTMLMPKKSHLLHKINPVIQHVIESGHMQKWARDLDMRRKIKDEMQRAAEDQFKNLTLSQVLGSFAFSGILLAFALLMFLVESAIHWLVVKRGSKLRLFKYIHRQLS